MPIVFWFSRLQSGATPDAYAAFVREVDYPAVERIPSIVRYYSLRVNGPAVGDTVLSYDFVDIAEVTDIEAYRKDLEEHPAALEVHGQSGSYVETIGTLQAELVEPDPSLIGKAPDKPVPTEIVLWYSRLQPGVAADDYEQWVRAVDYVGAPEVESLTSYLVYRVNGPYIGEAPFDYDYIEIARITDFDDYICELDETKDPAVTKIIGEIGSYVESVGSAWGMPVK